MQKVTCLRSQVLVVREVSWGTLGPRPPWITKRAPKKEEKGKGKKREKIKKRERKGKRKKEGVQQKKKDR